MQEKSGHHFGHALGLDHEHQQSELWTVLDKCLDTEKMMIV